jgi:parallel beta-helix repeat protein
MVTVIIVLWLCGCGNSPAPSTPAQESAKKPIPEEVGPRTLVVEAGGTYKSISAALRVAKDGDTVKVGPGTYEGGFAVSRTVTLLADGKPGEVTLEANLTSVITFCADEGKLSGFKIRQTGTRELVAVHVKRGHLALEDCDIAAESSAGVVVEKGGNAELRRNKIHDCKGSGAYSVGVAILDQNELFSNSSIGICIEGGEATVRNNSIYHNVNNGVYMSRAVKALVEKNKLFENGNGISIFEKSEATVTDNDVYANKQVGADIRGAGTKVTFLSNKVHQNPFSGIHIEQLALVSVADCDVYGNSSDMADGAVSVSLEAKVTIQHCKLHDNESNAVCVHHQGKATIEDSDVYANHFPGICLTGEQTAIIKKNRIYGHLAHPGISVVEGSTGGTFEENDVHDNAGCGVRIRSGSRCTLRRNTISKNGQYAIQVFDNSGGVFEENDLGNNARGPWEVARECKSTVTRARNKEDETPLLHAKVGDWVEYKMMISAGGMKREQNTRVMVKQKTTDELTVEIADSTEDGKTTKKSDTVWLCERQDFVTDLERTANAEVLELERGQEALTVCGKQMNAKWTKYKVLFAAKDGNEVSSDFRVWTCPEVPLENTVRVRGELPGQGKVEIDLTAYGDATTTMRAPPPRPDAKKPETSTGKTEQKPGPAGTGATIYVLKDGKKIAAAKIVDAGDELSIKDNHGQFHLIKKSDIEQTIKE